MKFLIAFVAPLCWFVVSIRASESKPNILLIYSDDHGWADLGIQDVDSDIATPNLDQLAKDGVRFTRGYVSAPQCVPSRAGVITGRYQQRFGVEDNLKGPSPTDEVTIAERLKTAGYVTGMSGKWHLDISGQKGGSKDARMMELSAPHRQGFDEYWRGELRNYYASHDLQGEPFSDPPRELSDERFRVVVQTEAALSFLDRRAKQPDQPWFFYLAWYAPHVPLDSPEPWFSKTPAHLPLERRQALSMIAAMDDGLGKIRAKLQSMNQAKNTLIVFIGDNGAPVKPGAWNGSLNAPLIGEKGMLTDGGIRVPFVAAWPSRIPAGTTFEHPVINLDIAATAVAMAGQARDDKLDGVNLIPFITGENQSPPHDLLFWRWRSQAAILEFPWKLIWLGNRPRYLFDVTKPDGELAKNNLIDKHPQVVQRLEAKWKGWSEKLQPPGAPDARNDQDNLFFSAHVEQTGSPPAKRQRSSTSPAAASPGIRGWISRGGSLAENDGLLEVTANSDTASFVTINQLKVPLDATVKVTLKSSVGGKITLAWRTAEESDFSSENRSTLQLKSTDWETHEVRIPGKGTLIHLRLHLPNGTSQIRSFDVIPDKGKPEILWK